MSSDQRTVIRSSWKVHFSAFAAGWWLPLLVVVGVGSHRAIIAMVVALACLVVLLRITSYVELTPRGLDLHAGLGIQTVPWLYIGSVNCVTKRRNSYLTVEDLRSNRTRRLPAPRAVFGIDEAQVEQARALIERWRQAHGGPDPVTPPAVDLGLA